MTQGDNNQDPKVPADSHDNRLSEPYVPPRRPKGSSMKWYAIIAVLIVIIAAFGVLAFYHPVSSGSSASVVSAQSIATYDQPYNLTLKTNGAFQYVTVYWGDGHTTIFPYQGSSVIKLSHIYRSPGQYYIYYTVDFASSVFTGNMNLVNVDLSEASTALSQYESYGALSLQSSSSAPVVNNTMIFGPKVDLSFIVGYFTPPANSSYQVIGQTVNVYENGSQIASKDLQYLYNASDGSYFLPVSASTFNLTSLQQGYYVIQVKTYTASVNSTTGVTNSSEGIYDTSYYVDIPVFSKASLYVTPSTEQVFVRARDETGGYKTLDSAVAYDGPSLEIIRNVMATLVGYNGSSTTGFFPDLAAYLPSTTNGGINTNYHNYTVSVNSKVAGYSGSYSVEIKPYENYTFHIRSNATFQNGQSLTAWDVMYSMVRTLLFDNGEPGTPGWIQAQYLLPGYYYDTNTFWNITQNITVDNATNNITFHFQTPMSPSLVFEVLGQVAGMGTMDASWLEAHGGAITWNATGFNAYKAHGNAGDYVNYSVNNVMASGPYEIDYTVPASEVVLIANPNYNPPANSWAPRPSIKKVVIEYIGETSTRYLQLKSGYAQAAGIPTSDWYLVQGLQSSGAVKVYSFPTISIYFYNFNANINEAMLSTVVPSANIPSTFFDSIHVRRAFADAYNYTFFLNEQIGNAQYNTTFSNAYAGMLPNGMLYSQNISVLKNLTMLPGYSLNNARANFTDFVNDSLFKAMDLTVGSNGYILYNGKPLNIPIFIFSADPINAAGATTWGDNLQKVIPGLQFEVIPTPVPNMLGYLVPGSNPMPVYDMSWGPDYPYPTDYLGPMGYPGNSTDFPGPNAMTPYWFADKGSGNPVAGVGSMVAQAANMSTMRHLYDMGASNPSQGKFYFQKLNEMLINMTFYVYTNQVHNFWVMSSHVDPTDIYDYQENVMLGGDGFIMYNTLSYT